MPAGVEEGIIRGMYRYKESDTIGERKAHLMGSGSIMTQVLRASELLEEIGISTDIWSVTSYNELARDGLQVQRRNRLRQGKAESCYVEELLANETGVFVAASDYMKAQPMSIAPWVPGKFTALGTDGYGLSESRPDLRDHFEVSAEHIAYAAVAALVDEGKCVEQDLDALTQKLNINRNKLDSAKAGPAQVRAARGN
jgi:pyruvate dehydrogenase E1 component